MIALVLAFLLSVDTLKIPQGQTALVRLDSIVVEAEGVAVFFDGEPMPVFDYSGKKYILLVADFRKEPGNYELIIKAGQKILRRVTAKVEAVDFPVDSTNQFKPKPKLSKFEEKEEQRKQALWAEVAKSPPQPIWEDNFVFPLRKIEIKSEFGKTRLWKDGAVPHGGVDLKAQLPKPVHAISRGEVIWANNKILPLEGRMVVLDHGQKFISLYLHLSRIKVKKGRIVKSGQLIGLTGATGNARGPHLHFAIKVGKAYVDPLQFIRIFNEELK